jgi:hypothetical protein
VLGVWGWVIDPKADGAKKVPYTQGDKYNVLVVRIAADGHLGDSKPCCMCVYLMKVHGIKKVYYSDGHGNLCCQKISQMCDEVDYHISHGLKMMISHCKHSGDIIGKKLPLTRKQKNHLISLAKEQ